MWPNAQPFAEIVHVAAVGRRRFDPPVIGIEALLHTERTVGQAGIHPSAHRNAGALIRHELSWTHTEALLIDEIDAWSRRHNLGNVVREHRDESVQLRIFTELEAHREGGDEQR